jgi:hypothetical protein
MAVALPNDPEARFAMLLATDVEFRDAWTELLADPAFQRSYTAIGEGGQATLRAGWTRVWETVHGPIARVNKVYPS